MSAEGIDLLEDFRSLIAAFEREGVSYAVVGALALAVHGFPRATTDIDFLIPPQDLPIALRAAATVGYRFAAEPMKFASGIEVQRVTKVASGDHLVVDLLLVNALLQEIWDGRVEVNSERGALTVVSRQGLVEMKSLAGRPQDLVDLERLRDEEEH